MEKPTLAIPKWRPNNFFKKSLKNFNSFAGIISGSRCSGKSCILKWLLLGKEVNLVKKYDVIVVFSSSIETEFYKYLGTTLLFKKFNPQIITALKTLYVDRKSKNIKFNFLVILDDLAHCNLKYDNDISEMYLSGRHFGCSIIFLTQKLSLTSLNWKNNSTLIIICKNGSRKEKRYCADIIADVIDTKYPNLTENKLLQKSVLIQSEICENYRALAIMPYEPQKMATFKANLIKIKKKAI